MNIEDVNLEKEENVENPLQKIFDKQLQLMNKYKIVENLPNWPLTIDLSKHQIVVKDFKQRGMEEIAEAIEAFRKKEMDHFFEEMIDALHFLTELNLLIGLDSSYFKSLADHQKTYDENMIKLKENNSKYEIKIELADLYQIFGMICEKYGLAMNCLKNKPWKKDQKKTDVQKFNTILIDSYDTFIETLFLIGLDKDDIYNVYCKKREVNKFRIKSGY